MDNKQEKERTYAMVLTHYALLHRCSFSRQSALHSSRGIQINCPYNAVKMSKGKEGTKPTSAGPCRCLLLRHLLPANLFPAEYGQREWSMSRSATMGRRRVLSVGTTGDVKSTRRSLSLATHRHGKPLRPYTDLLEGHNDGS